MRMAPGRRCPATGRRPSAVRWRTGTRRIAGAGAGAGAGVGAGGWRWRLAVGAGGWRSWVGVRVWMSGCGCQGVGCQGGPARWPLIRCVTAVPLVAFISGDTGVSARPREPGPVPWLSNDLVGFSVICAEKRPRSFAVAWLAGPGGWRGWRGWRDSCCGRDSTRGAALARAPVARATPDCRMPGPACRRPGGGVLAGPGCRRRGPGGASLQALTSRRPGPGLRDRPVPGPGQLSRS